MEHKDFFCKEVAHGCTKCPDCSKPDSASEDSEANVAASLAVTEASDSGATVAAIPAVTKASACDRYGNQKDCETPGSRCVFKGNNCVSENRLNNKQALAARRKYLKASEDSEDTDAAIPAVTEASDVNFLVSGYNQGKVARVTLKSNDAHTIMAGDHTNMSWFLKKGDNVYGTQEWGGDNSLIRMKVNKPAAGSEEWSFASALLSEQTSGSPVHILEAESSLYLSNYGGASLVVVPLGENGELPEAKEIKIYKFECDDKDKTSRPHQTVMKGNNVWVVDLGCNKIRHFTRNAENGGLKENDGTSTDVLADRRDGNTVYKLTQKVTLNEGKEKYMKKVKGSEVEDKSKPRWSTLSPCAPESLAKSQSHSDFVESIDELLDAKPRHMALHPDPALDLAYVVLEGQPYVEVYTILATGAMEFKQRVVLTTQFGADTCPPFKNMNAWNEEYGDNQPYYGAEILISSDGHFVYASSRRSQDAIKKEQEKLMGIITVYEVNEEDGKLKSVQEYELEGKWARSMELTRDRTVLAVALQDTDAIQFLQLNAKSGKIEGNKVASIKLDGVAPAFITLE